MRKIVTSGFFAAAALFFTLFFSATAFAGQWKTNETGRWYENEDGSYPAACWRWIDDGDGNYRCYYFDENGYCLRDTKTPDDCIVDQDGAWCVDGTVQRRTSVHCPNYRGLCPHEAENDGSYGCHGRNHGRNSGLPSSGRGRHHRRCW